MVPETTIIKFLSIMLVILLISMILTIRYIIKKWFPTMTRGEKVAILFIFGIPFIFNVFAIGRGTNFEDILLSIIGFVYIIPGLFLAWLMFKWRTMTWKEKKFIGFLLFAAVLLVITQVIGDILISRGADPQGVRGFQQWAFVFTIPLFLIGWPIDFMDKWLFGKRD